MPQTSGDKGESRWSLLQGELPGPFPLVEIFGDFFLFLREAVLCQLWSAVA